MSVEGALTPRPYGFRHLVGAFGGNWASSAVWWLQPLLMSELVLGRGFSEMQVGLLVCVELGLMSISSAVMARFVPPSKLARTAAIGILIAIAASCLTLNGESYGVLLVARAIVGSATGAALMMTNSVAAGFDDPDRAFGKVTVVNIVFGIILIPMVGLIRSILPAAPSYGAIVVTFVIALVMVLVMPPTGRAEPEGGVPQPIEIIPPRQMRNIWLVALATFLIGLTSGTIYAFYGIIGNKAGLSAAEIDHAVSTAIFAGLVGAGLAAVIGSKFGRTIPITGACTLLAIAICMLTLNPTGEIFWIAASINIGALYFLVPYLLGSGSAQHSSGRGAAYVGAAFYSTGAVGPLVGGVFAETVGLGVFSIAACAITVIVIGIFIWVGAHSHEEGSNGSLAAISNVPAGTLS